MTTRAFTAEWLEANYIDSRFFGKLVVHREFVENQEYGSIWMAVFLYDGKHWQVTYQTPLGGARVDTWFGDEEVQATEVRPITKSFTEWIPVEKDSRNRCTVSLAATPPDGSPSGSCDMDAPFLITIRSDSGLDCIESCIAHAHMMLTSVETFGVVEEVNRRWR